MTETPDQTLTKLANAAFQRAARKVIERAEAAGTPVILWINGAIREIPAASLVDKTVGRSRHDRQSSVTE